MSGHHLPPAMDSISALSIAACILSITEFITDLLLSPPQISEAQPSQGGTDRLNTSRTLQSLSIALSDHQIPSVLQQPPVNAVNPSSTAAALRRLSSFRDAAAALLEDIGGILRQLPDERRVKAYCTEIRDSLRSRLAGTPYILKLKQLPRDVTIQVDAILR